MYKKFVILITCSLGILFILNMAAMSADKEPPKSRTLDKTAQIVQGPIVPDNWKFHRTGTFWHRVTNFSKTGDDAYVGRTPSGDWPGGSGNSYLYRGSIWLTARVDGVIHSTQTEDQEFAPIDSVHAIYDGRRGEFETYTRYYDVNAPLATGHVPLGLEVTERAYSWSESFRDDFIIFEYTIKNVGIDTDGDGYPDTPRDLEEFYFTFRMDGDVSKLPDWPAEYRFSNQDDLAGVNSNWGLLDLFPQWAAEAGDFFTDERADSCMMFMWDGDNPSYPAYEGGPDDDSFNPAMDGTYQTPGFLGYRILKTEPASFKPVSFHVNHIYNDPVTDVETYDRFLAVKAFGGGGGSGDPNYSGVVLNPKTQQPFVNDYRALFSLGPMETFKAGDSVVITAALGVGADVERAHVHSLKKLVEIMEVAQRIVDDNYEVVVQTAPPPNVEIREYTVDGVTRGMRLRWDKTPENSPTFIGYKVWKSAGRTRDNQFRWEPLGAGIYNRTENLNWPPPEASDDPNKYEVIDQNVQKGFDYYYAVQAMSEDPVYGYAETNPLNAMQTVIPANPPATDLSRVMVVPNPYVGSARWDNPRPGDSDPWKHRLQFTNIPSDATVKIFTLDFDFVAEVKSGDIARVSADFQADINYGVAEWDLITRNNQEAAPGIYLYVVDSPSAGQKVGKFVIVR